MSHKTNDPPEMVLWVGNPDEVGNPAPITLTYPGMGLIEGRLHVLFDSPQSEMLRAYWLGRLSLADQRTLGARLFQSVFQNKLRDIYHAVRGATRQSGEILKLRVVYNQLEAASLPWELLYDPGAGENQGIFLCQWPWFELAHSLPNAETISPPPGTTPSPTRIGIVSACPKGFAPLDIASELEIVQSFLRPHVEAGRLEWVVIPNVTRTGLRDLFQKPVTLFHFIGHAGHGGNSVLILEDGNGQADYLTPTELHALIGRSPPPVVFLNACRTGEVQKGLWTIGSMLLASGTLAVITSHTDLQDRQAPVFAGEVYRALVAGLPPERAVTQARAALLAEYGENGAEWYSPRLYLHGRSKENLFGVTTKELPREIWRLNVQMAITGGSSVEHRNRISYFMSKFLMVLGGWEIQADIKIQKILGAKAEIVSPHVTTVQDPPEFIWRMGEDLVRMAADAAAGGAGPLSIEAIVQIYRDRLPVWKSLSQEITISENESIAEAGNWPRSIPYTGEALAPGEYRWELVIDYPSPGMNNRPVYHRLILPSTFRVLSAEEWAAYQNIMGLLKSEPSMEKEWLMGVLAETLGFYDEAEEAYKIALQKPESHEQARVHLYGILSRRAWGVLSPDGIKHLTSPIEPFAERANAYAATV